MKNHYTVKGNIAKVFSNGIHKERFFIIDRSDLDKISVHSWRVELRPNGYLHVVASLVVAKKVVHFSLARFLLDFPLGHYTDHIDRNPINNRRNNLRIATPLENSHNAPKTKRKTTSKFKGVCFHKGKKLWFAYINCDKKRYNLGYFKSENEAANAYDIKAKELHVDFAVLNKVQKSE